MGNRVKLLLCLAHNSRGAASLLYFFVKSKIYLSRRMPNLKNSDDEKTLYTADGFAIRWLKKLPEPFVDYTTLVLGSSGSGKTKIVEEILYTCRDEFINYLVIAPETTYTKYYANKFPRRCWKEDLTKEKLIEIWNRQFHVTMVCNIANDMVILEKVFRQVRDREAEAEIKICLSHSNILMDKIDRNDDYDHSKKKDLKNFVQDKKNGAIKKIYVESITRHRGVLLNRELSQDERIAVEFLNVKPKLCIVIDDCTENLPKWQKYFKKNEENIFERIFFRGRHNNITLIIAAHDDLHISTSLRKNLRNCIFTCSKMLIASIERTNSGYSKSERDTLKHISDVVFNDVDTRIKTHKKVCYIREDPSPYQYTIANLYPDFSLANKLMLQLINRMPKKENQIVNNPYIKDIVKSTEIKQKRKIINPLSKTRKYVLQ